MSTIGFAGDSASLLFSAVAGANDAITFTFQGDLNQMSAQDRFLRSRGFKVGRRDVYPGVYSETDFKAALTLIFQQRVAGWHHYNKEYVKYGICTNEEYRSALGVKPE